MRNIDEQNRAAETAQACQKHQFRGNATQHRRQPQKQHVFAMRKTDAVPQTRVNA
jgi:hypothetical protein